VTRTRRWTDLVLELWTVRFVLWLVVVGFLVPAFLDHPYHLPEWMDDHQFQAWEWANYKTVKEYHQLPAWNPYWCGGTLGVAAPEDSFFAPDTILRFLFGVPRARHLYVVLAVFLGLEGTFQLARHYKASALGALFGALGYASFYGQYQFNHSGALNFILGFELLPWTMLGLVKGIDSVPWRFVGAFFLSWIFLSAGTYPAPFAVLILAYLTIATSMRAFFSPTPRAWIKPWKSLITIGLTTVVLTLCKLVPLMLFLRQFKRIWLPIEAFTPATLINDFAHQNGLIAAIAVIGLLVADEAALLFLGGGLLFFVLAMGDFDPLAPYHLLKQLPVLNQLRSPERYMYAVALFLALAASRSVTLIEDLVPALARRARALLRWGPERMGREGLGMHLLVGLSTLAVAAALYGPTRGLLKVKSVPPNSLYTFEPARPVDQPFRQARGNRRDGHVFTAAGLGTLYCIVGIPVPESPFLRADLPAEEYPLDPAKATVQRVRWTPNELELDVVAKEPSTVVVNQNWERHWVSNVGTVVNKDGLLAVDVPAGTHRLRLSFRDRLLYTCVAISATGALALLGYGIWICWLRLRDAFKRYRELPWWPAP
jgi:hypothetical protein